MKLTGWQFICPVDHGFSMLFGASTIPAAMVKAKAFQIQTDGLCFILVNALLTGKKLPLL